MAVVISERLRDGGQRLLDAEPDEQLVRLAQSGHDAAFAAIVRRYERELKAQAQRLTSDGSGEDAVQQAFLNAFSALQSGREVRHLRGWLHQILRNEITRARLPLEAPLDAAVVFGETLEDTVQRRAAAHATLAQLSALPERQRDALLGTAVFGFPRAHVARTMGLSEGAVRQLVHRARLRLRQAASAFIPFPVLRLFGAARSGVDTAPDAALGAGTAASGGLAIKVGALLASGAVATGIAVTHTFPARHPAPSIHGARHHVAHPRAAWHGAAVSAPSVTPGEGASVVARIPVGDNGTPAGRAEGRSHGGPAGARSGRRGETESGRGTDDTRGGDDGSRGSRNTGSGRSHDGNGSVSRSGTTSGSASASGARDDGGGSSSGRDGSGSSSRDGNDSGSRSGSGTGSAFAAGSAGSGSGSGDGSASQDGGHDSGSSGTASTPSGTTSAPSGTATGAATSDGGATSGGDGTRDGGSGGGSGQDSSAGSRDVSGSSDSSSS